MKINKKNLNLSVKNRLLLTVTSLIMGLGICITVTFAWFNDSQKSSFNGIKFNIYSASVKFDDTVTVVRSLANRSVTIVYKKDTDERFYEYENNAFVYEEDVNGTLVKKPISLAGLLPDESIDFFITLKSSENVDNYHYTIGLKGLDGKLFTVNGIQYSVLGLYRLNLLNKVTQGDNVTYVEDANSQWFATYGDTPVVNSKIVIKNALWSNDKQADNTVCVNFRLTVDLTQYRGINISNDEKVLSEALIQISELFTYIEE